MEEYIKIKKRDYEFYRKRERELCALENGGVDNWYLYDRIMERFFIEEKKREEN